MYDLFSEIFNDLGFVSPIQHTELKCPLCGHTYSDFRNSGKLGCGECYNTFRAPLSVTLKQIHQNPVHKGKVPKTYDEKIRKKRELENLKAELSTAVKAEDYEAAAKIHKRIKDLERGEDK